MRKSLILMFALFAVSLFADDRGKFSDEQQIVASSETASDTVMIATTSKEYPGWPTMTIYYKFLDGGTVATEFYFEAVIKGNSTLKQYVKIDSLTVSTKLSEWRVWNITDSAIGVADSWRLRKSVNTDTVQLVFKGYNANFD